MSNEAPIRTTWLEADSFQRMEPLWIAGHFSSSHPSQQSLLPSHSHAGMMHCVVRPQLIIRWPSALTSLQFLGAESWPNKIQRINQHRQFLTCISVGSHSFSVYLLNRKGCKPAEKVRKKTYFVKIQEFTADFSYLHRKFFMQIYCAISRFSRTGKASTLGNSIPSLDNLSIFRVFQNELNSIKNKWRKNPSYILCHLVAEIPLIPHPSST